MLLSNLDSNIKSIFPFLEPLLPFSVMAFDDIFVGLVQPALVRDSSIDIGTAAWVYSFFEDGHWGA